MSKKYKSEYLNAIHSRITPRAEELLEKHLPPDRFSVRAWECLLHGMISCKGNVYRYVRNSVVVESLDRPKFRVECMNLDAVSERSRKTLWWISAELMWEFPANTPLSVLAEEFRYLASISFFYGDVPTLSLSDLGVKQVYPLTPNTVGYWTEQGILRIEKRKTPRNYSNNPLKGKVSYLSLKAAMRRIGDGATLEDLNRELRNIDDGIRETRNFSKYCEDLSKEFLLEYIVRDVKTPTLYRNRESKELMYVGLDMQLRSGPCTELAIAMAKLYREELYSYAKEIINSKSEDTVYQLKGVQVVDTGVLRFKFYPEEDVCDDCT